MSSKPLNRVVLILLYIALAVGAVYLVTLPFHMGMYMKPFLSPFTTSLSDAVNTIITILWMLVTLGGLLILVDLILMMHSLKKDPFVKRNVTALLRMGFVALVMVILCVVILLLCFLWPIALFAAALLLCGLFSLVLSGVFARAVAYKDENDLTI